MSADLERLAKQAVIGELEHLRDELRKLVEPLTEKQCRTRPNGSGWCCPPWCS